MKGATLWNGPVIDAHQHFWDPFTNYHPWLSPDVTIPFRYGDYSAIKRRYLPDDYFADAAKHNVAATVYVETEWDPLDPIGETTYVTALAQRHGVPNAIVAQAWLHRNDAAETLAAQATCGLVRSIRHKPGGAARPDEVGHARTLMSDDRWRKGFAALARHGLHFDLQTAWWNLDEAVLLARDFPETRIILNHTGLPADRSEAGLAGWHQAMARLADCENAFVKISGLGVRGRPWTVSDNHWIVRETIAMFGASRCMFASNFPVDSLCASFEVIYSGFKTMVADLPEPDQHQLFFGTALATYRIGDGASSLRSSDNAASMMGEAGNTCQSLTTSAARRP